MTSRLLFVGLLFFAFGCSEGAKPDPLPRGSAGVSLPKKAKDPQTLYERLGREEGLTQIVNQLVKELEAASNSAALAGRLKKRTLIDFLMEVSSRPRTNLADEVMLSPADWALLIPALRAALDAQGQSPANRDELLAGIENSR